MTIEDETTVANIVIWEKVFKQFRRTVLGAGMIGINKGCGGAAGSPWVGAKQSGYGYHGSKAGHRQFAQARVVSLPKGE